MNTPFRPKTILVFLLSVHTKSDRAKLEGIYDYATRHRWQVQVFTGSISAVRYLRLVHDWRPAGCIIDGSLRKSSDFPPRVKSVPVIQLGNSYGVPPLRDIIRLDNSKIAQAAAEILLKRTANCFGYVSALDNPPWSQARGKFFADHLKAAGIACNTLKALSAHNDTNNMKACIRFLSHLRKPACIMLACDNLAPLVYAAARKLHLKMPEDISVISVDNDLSICTNLKPTLSSIEPDFQAGAFMAGERFGARVGGVKGPLPPQTYDLATIAFRQSTTFTGSPIGVKAALDWIDQHAKEPIHVPDVVAIMGYGRRRAEQLFLNSTGKTIGAAINDARLANVLAMLRNSTLRISDIASICGFRSSAYLAAVFRKRYQMTISEWKHRIKTSSFTRSVSNDQG